MSAHFIVAVEHGQLRIYIEGNTLAPFPPRVQLVESIDLGDADTAPLEHTPHERSRFPGMRAHAAGDAVHPGHGSGRREALRRAARLIAAKLQAFWQDHPMTSWDLAASPALYTAIIDALSPETTRRLKRVYSNELIGQGGALAVGVTAVAD